MKKTVYNVKTGKSAEIEGVDAQEYVATGGWAFEPPTIEVPKRRRKKDEA